MTTVGFRYYGHNNIGRDRKNRLMFPQPVFNDPRGDQLESGKDVKIRRDTKWNNVLLVGDVPDTNRYTIPLNLNKPLRAIGSSDRRLSIPSGLLIESEGAVPKPPTDEDGNQSDRETTTTGADLLFPGERIHFLSRLKKREDGDYEAEDFDHSYLLTDEQLNTLITAGWRPEEYIDVTRMNDDEFYRAINPLSEVSKSGNKKQSGLRKKIGRVFTLGSAQDGGIPHLDCPCPVCEDAREDPEATRKINSLLVKSLGNPDEHILFEATPDIRYQIDSLPHHIFLSHDFSGHIAGLASLSFESINADNIPVYCTSELADIVSKGPFERLVRNNNIDIQTVSDGTSITVGSITIDIVEITYRWGDTDALAYRIYGQKGQLAYAPIVSEWTRDLLEIVDSADRAIVDGILWDDAEVTRNNVPDVTIRETIEAFDAHDIGTDIYFTRLNHTNEVLEDGPQYEKLNSEGYQLVDQDMDFTI